MLRHLTKTEKPNDIWVIFFLETKNKETYSYEIKNLTIIPRIGETVSIETLIANNKNLDPLEVAFGVLLREVDENGVEKKFNEDDFLYVIEQLKTKVMLLDVYNVISFFLSTDKSSSKTSKGYSIHKKQKKSLHVE